jgi:ubiquinone/menaquinone biosynthesis C-methylase UbiE
MSTTTMTNFDWQALPADYASRYQELNARYGHIYSVAAARLLTLAAVGHGNTVVDVGAGIGLSTAEALEATGGTGRVLAIDPSPLMLTAARAQQRLEAAEFQQGGAEELRDIAFAADLIGKTDTVMSSFTYYYTYESRSSLYAAIMQVLKPGGRWTFNLTRYLGAFEIEGRTYNQYSSTYMAALRRVARRHGLHLGAPGSAPQQFTSTSWELEALRNAGFANIRVEAWPLPLTPSQANRFTLDGFYRYGSRTAFAPELMNLELEHRIGILQETLAECEATIDAAEPPHVANFVALRP